MSMDGITIVLRSRHGELIEPTLESIQNATKKVEDVEVIVVSTGEISVHPKLDIDVKMVTSDAKRIEAKRIGVAAASKKRILFLDSDQLVAENLFESVIKMQEDMIFIPERSMSKNLVAKTMDSQRKFIEDKMRERPSLDIPVIPRLFVRHLLTTAFKSLDEQVIKNVTETEDSIIFYECLKYSKSMGWTGSLIYNRDPDVLTFIRKSYQYGLRNESSIAAGVLPPEYVNLIRRLQKRTFLNSWYAPRMVQLNYLLRGVPYLAGSLIARVKHRRIYT